MEGKGRGDVLMALLRALVLMLYWYCFIAPSVPPT